MLGEKRRGLDLTPKEQKNCVGKIMIKNAQTTLFISVPSAPDKFKSITGNLVRRFCHFCFLVLHELMFLSSSRVEGILLFFLLNKAKTF